MSQSTIRIMELSPLDGDIQENFQIPLVDTGDTSVSPDGKTKRTGARSLLEKTPVRVGETNEQKTLKEWMDEFHQKTTNSEEKTQEATESRFGITRYATDEETQEKETDERSITPKNLSGLNATADLTGLVMLATAQQILEGSGSGVVNVDALFEGFVGDAVLGNNSWVFKTPFKNVANGAKMELVLQFGQTEFDTMETGSDPGSNFNHIHQTVRFSATYPEEFPNRTLMVIPMSVEVTPSDYMEGTDFIVRQESFSKSGVNFKATRLTGTSSGNERGGVRYLAIGY